MKKIFISMIILFMGAFHVNAQNEQSVSITVEDVNVPEKGMANIVVNYDTGGKILKGYGFTLKLPPGLSFVMDGLLPKVEYVNGAGFGMTYMDGNFGFLPSVPASSVSVASGTLLMLTIQADETLKEDDSFVVEMTDIIVTDDKLAEIPVPKTSFTINIVENRVPFDEMAESMPFYDDSSTNNVQFTRSFQAGKWNTLVLPFTMTYADFKVHFGEDVNLAQWTGWTLTGYNSSDNTASAIELTFTAPKENQLNKQGIVGGTIYLVKTSKSKVDFSLDGVKIVDKVTTKTITDEEDSWEDAVLKGTFVKSTVPANGVFISSNKFYYSTGSTIMKGFRAWFEIPITIDSASGAKVSFRVDDETTSIEGLNLNSMNEGVYDLSGRKIKLENGDVTKLQKGVYIIDGKKVTIK